MLHLTFWRIAIATSVLAVDGGIDVNAVNPLGWRRSPPGHLGILIDGVDDAAGWREVAAWSERVGPERVVALMAGGSRRERRRAERAHGVLVELLAPADDRNNERRRGSSDGDHARSRQLQGLRAVIARGDLDNDRMHQHTAWLLEVAARRLPILPPAALASDTRAARQPVGDAALANRVDPVSRSGATRGVAAPDLAEIPPGPVGGVAEVDRIVAATTMADVDDDHTRERIGVSLRRAAVATRQAAVSVVMATNRPTLLADALRQIEAQTHPELETVLAIHGTLDAGIRRDLEAAATRPLTIIDVGADATLGEVLNCAVAASSGEIVTKMDDDDFYDPEHIADLLDALAYSGAQLVGKGSEFVYLAEIDTTIRRFPNGVETANRNLAGGTLMIRREDLAAAGGWRDVPKAVDQALIDDVVAAGGAFHRTHGLGFILNRHGTAHTWDASADYFLQQATAQWPGLARDAAGWSPT